MTAYVIFHETIHDPDAFERYKSMAQETIAAFNGKFVVRGGPIDVLEGAFEQERVVVIEFPDRQAAKDWHASEVYAPAKQLRLQISTGDAVLVDGV